MKAKSNKYRRQIAYYTALKAPDPGMLTPHACAIVSAIQSFGDRPVSRAELVAALAKRIKGSKQSPTRIISFHKKTLLAANFIRVTKKPEPLKEKKTAKATPVVAPPAPVVPGSVLGSVSLEPVIVTVPATPVDPAGFRRFAE